MKILVADRIVATSHDFPTVNCTIDPEDMRYISSLLRNNYSNTILATIRETYANAVDANKEPVYRPQPLDHGPDGRGRQHRVGHTRLPRRQG